MKFFLPIVLTAVIVSAACGVLIFEQLQKDCLCPAPMGSVARGGEYHATTSASMAAGKHRLVNYVANNASILGSIIVASGSPTTMTIWNATSTKDVSSSSAFTFPAAMTVGTYVFDMILTRGLSLELPSQFNGDYIITYR